MFPSLQAISHHLFPSLLEKQRDPFYLSPNDQRPALPILYQIPIWSGPSYLSSFQSTYPLFRLFYVQNPYRKLHRLSLTNPSFFFSSSPDPLPSLSSETHLR